MVQLRQPGGRSASDRRALGKKRDILRAASAVFRRQGLHATGMRDIAAEAGMHAGNLYYYFENKHEILAFCQQESLDELLEMAERLGGEEQRADKRLSRLIVEHVRILNESIPGSLAHLDVEALAEPWRAEILRRRDRYEAVFRTTVQQGQRAGVFRPADPKVVALGILGALNWTVKWYQPEGHSSTGAIGREFAALLVGGLLATGVDSAPDLPSIDPRQDPMG